MNADSTKAYFGVFSEKDESRYHSDASGDNHSDGDNTDKVDKNSYDRTSENEGGNDDRNEKCRERNREHAKRTRLRKKVMLESLKSRLLELQAEASRLQLALEESNTANILLCLGAKPDGNSNINSVETVDDVGSPLGDSRHFQSKGNIIDQIRNIVRAEAAIFLKPKFENSQISAQNGSLVDAQVIDDEGNVSEDEESVNEPSKSSMGTKNWKNGTVINNSSEKTTEDLDSIRKERNRMHAKLTRDRKKMFTSRLHQLINALERQNATMRARLQQLATGGSRSASPVVQPLQIDTKPIKTEIPSSVPSSESNSPREGYRIVHNSFHPIPMEAFGLNPTLTMTPSINYSAFPPVALKRKAFEAFPENSTFYQQQLQQQFLNHQRKYYS